MKSIAFINQKGGVGKSTITLNTASYLVRQGKKVLTIDLDPQGNLSQAYGIDTTGVATLREVMLGEVSIDQAVYQTQYGYIIPSDIALGHSERQIAGSMGCETILRKALMPLLNGLKNNGIEMDYVLIDCPPAFNVFTYNALNVSTDVVIPCKAEEWSLQGLEQFYVIKRQVEESFERNINVVGVVINMFQSNIKTQVAYIERFKEAVAKHGTVLIGQTVRLSTDVNTAVAQSKSVFDYKPNCPSAKDMEIALNEVVENVKGDNR